MRAGTFAVAFQFGVAALVAGWSGAAHAASWVPVAAAAPATLDTCLLLTNGTVMCHQSSSNQWHRLSPDQSGSYINGAWDSPPISPMPNGTDTSFGACATGCTYGPLYFASAVLADGRVVVIGGEYNTPGGQVWTNMGFMYDPATDPPGGTCPGCGSWSAQLTNPFPGNNFGDAQSVILQNGTMLIAGVLDRTQPGNVNKKMASFDPATLTFTAFTPIGKADGNDEENWNILPDGTFLTVDSTTSSQYEIYNATTNTWTAGAMPVNLADTPTGSAEVGPCILRPDGGLVCFSATQTGLNAIYDTITGTWSRPADIDFPEVPMQSPNHFAVKDGPASLLPNGNVLVMASPVDDNKDNFNPPSHMYEVQYEAGNLIAVEDPANASSFASYQGRMLLLPSGEVLLTANGGGSSDVTVYTAGGTPLDGWRPVITSSPSQVLPGNSYTISGRLFNGFSEGAAYGDDAQMATNYPLVRITNTASGHVVYARTHNHSRMGVEAVTSTEVVSTTFDAPAGMEPGPSTLVVVANGIPSASVGISTNRPPVAVCRNVTKNANGMCVGTALPGDVDNGSSDPDGDPITCTLAPAGPFALGATSVVLTCVDPSGATGSCTATITVVDATPPTLMVPANRASSICTDSSSINVGQATVTDNCPGATVSGQVIAKNGVPLAPPIPVTGGLATLGVGTYTVRWTATDGPNTVTANETVTVAPGIEAAGSFLVDDRGQVRNNAGGFAAMLNAGTGTTKLGNDGRSGAILSVGPVSVLHRAIANGNVTSAGTVTKESDGTITGTITSGGSVTLPPLPTLPAFPPATAGSFTVNSGTQTHAPGSYVSGTVNGGTLVLNSGDYFFQSLTINSGVTVRVTPTTRIFVRNTLFFNSPLRASSGTAIQASFLGFAGASVSLNAQFDGTLIVPNGTVLFGTGSGLTYTGSFFARDIEVTPASALVCKVN
jgi:hypothetical protein